MTRRSKYLPEVVEALIGAIETGATDENACAEAGIDESTFYDWIKKKPDFANRVQRARPMGWIDDLRLIRKAARDGDWRAAAEHLDRTRSPYRKSQGLELTGEGGGPIRHEHVHRALGTFTEDEIDALAVMAERRTAGELPS